MKTIKNKKTKITLIITMITLIAAAFPMSSVFAESMNDQSTPTDSGRYRRLTLPRIWTYMQNQYNKLGNRLERTDQFISRLQKRIDTANQNGKDTASIQAALDVFINANNDALLIHKEGEAIINLHAGFDSDGKVIDRAMAVNSVESLSDVIRETRDARRDPFRLLRDALRSFREANKSDSATSVPSP